MARRLPPIVLKGKQLAKYRCLQRKYPVSGQFLQRNWANLERFILYAMRPRCVIRKYAWRKRNRVFIKTRPRLILFDPRLKRMIKRRKASIKRWSGQVVQYLKQMGHITEYEETELYGEELTKQMKQQLELLKSAKRSISLIEDANRNVEVQDKECKEEQEQLKEEEQLKGESQVLVEEPTSLQPSETKEQAVQEHPPTKEEEEEEAEQQLPETSNLPVKEQEKSASAPNPAPGSNFLDMLMSKVRVKNFAKESNFFNSGAAEAETDVGAAVAPVDVAKQPPEEDKSRYSFNEDISEDFVGFDDQLQKPGMMRTPLVPQSCKTVDGNAAFVSDALEAFMKTNKLRESSPDESERLLEPIYQDGRVTAHSMPPPMDMPAVPPSLQRLRTVADRRYYLLRNKNQKMAIINNESNIYRELQRKQRQRKVKIAAMQQLQSHSSQMPFTRQGWQAASYVSTEHDRYYYQVMRIDGQLVRLPGSQGNNVRREKQPHCSRLTEKELAASLKTIKCNGGQCPDATLRDEMTVVMSTRRDINEPKLQRLNQYPLPAIFRPCPLSQKPYQKPLDDDTAALLLAGGSMAVVSMPTVQLDVKPQLGRPLDEIAKRYLQYILPHHDITREWAEFSVATLQSSSSCSTSSGNHMRDAEARVAETPAGRRKSFTFVIPYLNDRNHILVRRVVDRSEQLDESFSGEQPPERLMQFTFDRQQEETKVEDTIALDCADMIKEMINTVAISCSENSFLTNDPDAIQSAVSEPSINKEELPTVGAGKATDKSAKLAGSKRRTNTNHTRLTKELRRLNATIIDAGVITKEDAQPCQKDHCQLGCLCDSLEGKLPLREHCGRAECVLGCHCSGAELTRVMRVETDGRGLSNEDAFNLRRKATARLAKLEKDFTSTLVLTDNETLLINETQCDKKRRCTKAPKRYEDFEENIEDEDDDDEHAVLARPAKLGKRELSVKMRPNRSTAGTMDAVQQQQLTNPTPLSTLQRKPYRVKDTDYVQLKHCRVMLRRLEDVDNLATFCMTHQLYKCFCGGFATEGKPVVIEKEQSQVAIEKAIYVPELARAFYSFERPPEELPAAKKARKESSEKQPEKLKVFIKREEKEDDVLETAVRPPSTISTASLPQERPAELDIVYGYFRSRPYMCRRVIPVPRNCYLRMNRRRAARILQEMCRTETPQLLELLNKRIESSVRFYRAELNEQRRLEQNESLLKHRASSSTSVIIVCDDDSDEMEAQPVKLEAEQQQQLPMKRKRSLPLGKDEQESKEQPPAKQRRQQQQQQQKQPEQQARSEIQMPKIASCFSLNTAGVELSSTATSAGLNVASLQSRSNGNGASGGSGVSLLDTATILRNSYDGIIRKMNQHVSKKMEDIEMALRRESKIIPMPNEDILCIIKWTNFLAAFESDLAFIWDIQMKNYNFLAATTTNMMPSVCGAYGVVNIKFISSDASNLPLMARMLLERKRNAHTEHLAVVMQGRQQYWVVKGFLRYVEGSACIRPTPASHPLLSKKINVLCSLMVKQHLREETKRQEAAAMMMMAQAPSTDPVQPATAVPVANTLAASTAPSTFTASGLNTMPSLKPAAVAAPPGSKSSPPSKTNSKLTALPTLKPASSKATPKMEMATPLPNTPNIHSNFDFRRVQQSDIGALQVPECHDEDHRWLVLNLFDDFSHIFVPAFRDMISLDRINHVAQMALASKKMVKLRFFKDAPYDAFVMPSSKRNIYFGPLKLDVPPPVLVLLQSVDAKMMLREVYQREHGIKVDPEKSTRAFWVFQINKKVHFEIEMMDSLPGAPPKQVAGAKNKDLSIKQVQAKEEQSENDSDDDDDEDEDCMIIEDDLVAKKSPPAEEQTRHNFTIQSAPTNGGGLQILPSPSTGTAATTTSAVKQLSTASAIGSGGFVPFISNVPATNLKAPATQLLTPQVQLTQTTTPVAATATTASSLARSNKLNVPPIKISRISVQRCETPSGIVLANPATPAAAKVSPTSSTAAKPPINPSLQQLFNGGCSANIKLGSGTGVTITKLIPPKDAGHIPSLPTGSKLIKIASNQLKAVVKLPATVTAATAATTTNTPPAATISITNVRSLPLPVKLQSLPGGERKSLPGKQPAQAQAQPRASLPIKLSTQQPQSQLAATPPTTAPAPRQHPVYGFLVSRNLPKYRAKKVDENITLKLPDGGKVTFRNHEAASAYLNKHLSQLDKWKDHVPGTWIFVPVKNVQMVSPQNKLQLLAKTSSESQLPPIVIED